jgi:peptidyl-prolyl cis-trans isomerase D
MQQFRNLLKGWFGKVLLAIFILPFAFFGIEGIFMNSGRSDVAIVVNGVEISKPEVDRAISAQREAMVQRMGGNIDGSFFTDEMLRPRVIESLIQRELLAQAVKDEGLHVANEAIKSYVRNMPQFRDDATGTFSQEKLETVLARAGYTPLRFYDELSSGMVTEQLQQAIGLSAFATEQELKTLVQLDGQKRDLSYATLKLDRFQQGAELGEADINAYFEANREQYRTEERVRIQYLAFKASDFAADVAVTDEDLQKEYADYVHSQEGQERRRASHILVEINDDRDDAEALSRIQEAKAKLDGGEDFAVVAKTYSDDVATASTGGDLDFAGRGIYDPAFDSALFSLKEGATSDIVKTEFGYHLIKLTGIESVPVASLEEKREELAQRVRDTRSAEQLSQAIDQMNELTYAAGDLSAVAEKFGKPVQESESFSRRGGSGITADAKVIEAAFSENLLKEGMNSSAIELADGSVVVMRVSLHEPARDRALEEVRDQVVTALKMQKARDKASETAQQIVDKLKAGATLEALADEFEITWVHQAGVGRQSADVSRTIVTKLFELPTPAENVASVDKVGLPSGDQEIVVLTKVTEGEFKLSDDETLQALLSTSNHQGQLEFDSYIATLKSRATIVQK